MQIISNVSNGIKWRYCKKAESRGSCAQCPRLRLGKGLASFLGASGTFRATGPISCRTQTLDAPAEANAQRE